MLVMLSCGMSITFKFECFLSFLSVKEKPMINVSDMKNIDRMATDIIFVVSLMLLIFLVV